MTLLHLADPRTKSLYLLATKAQIIVIPLLAALLSILGANESRGTLLLLQCLLLFLV